MVAPAALRLGQSEAAFQAAVIELARRLDWRVAHFRTTREVDRRGRARYQTAVAGDGAGWPDLVLVRRGTMILAELKADRGTVRTEQRAWLERLEEVELNAGGAVLVRVWRPRDWPSIELELGARRPPP